MFAHAGIGFVGGQFGLKNELALGHHLQEPHLIGIPDTVGLAAGLVAVQLRELVHDADCVARRRGAGQCGPNKVAVRHDRPRALPIKVAAAAKSGLSDAVLVRVQVE